MLDWLYTAISRVMQFWHWIFSFVFPAESGIAWALSIMFLVVTIRVALFRLFIRQVKSQRAMQEIQPEIQKLRKQYGADRQGFSAAVMTLQKERGVNPLAGCLPILPQIPVFVSLFHVLRRITPQAKGLYGWDTTLTHQAAVAKLFGAPISSSFNMQEPKQSAILELTGGSYTPIRVVALILMVVMCFTTFYTQKQIMRRSGPLEGQAAMVQRLMLYGMPVSLFVSGFFFPIGVLLYWLTNNLWTLGQQFYILKKLPPPGSPAAEAKAAIDRPAVDPRSLAPRPGAKPVRGKPGLPAGPATPTTAADGLPTDASPSDGAQTAPPVDKSPDSTTPGTTSTGSNASGRSGNGSSPNGNPNGKPPADSPPGRRGQGPPRGKRKRR